MTGSSEKHTFQAEVKQVLDIVVHSLYTDKEIFVRELVSNASDASEKLRHLQLTEKDISESTLPLEINITSDDTTNTLTIQDFGIGMTREELIENLGTIAHSGSKAFIEALKAKGTSNENLIGQFGVGFYSVFMVADEVKVYTHSWKPNEKGYCWSSDGSSTYSIEEAEGLQRGSKIVVKLKDEFKEFSQKSSIDSILKRYSNFVAFPIQLNGEKINTKEAVWLKNKSEITEEEYKEFYKFQANAFEDPLFWLHFNADAPLTINALLYSPKRNTERLGFGKADHVVSLYCKKVIISSDPKNLLPEWLRFLKGVIDSADLPLNISRESMQDSALMQKINTVVTRRFIKKLEELAKNEAATYEIFWKEFGIHIKEGVVVDSTHREALAPLLRFESSSSESKLISLQDYLQRCTPTQKNIYYLVGSSRKILESSPYLEAFKSRNIEVLFFYEPIDEFVTNHLGTFEGKTFISIDQANLDLEEKSASTDIATDSNVSSLTPEEISDVCAFLENAYDKKLVEKVSASQRLTESPALALNTSPAFNPNMRRMMKMMNPDGPDTPIQVNLEINPKHPLLINLAKLKDSNPDLAKLIAEQLLDNALLAAGLVEDPKSLVNRINQLLEKVSYSQS